MPWGRFWLLQREKNALQGCYGSAKVTDETLEEHIASDSALLGRLVDKLVPKGRDGEEVIWRMGLPKKGNGGSKGMEVRMLGEWEGVEERLL